MEEGASGDWEPFPVEATDFISPAPIRRLAATFDLKEMPWPEGELPPLGHWLFFLPEERQSRLDVDGHFRRGGVLPSVAAPRRMWASGKLSFLKPVPLMAEATKRSIVEKVEHKEGRTGPLIFVTVRHDVFAGGEHCVSERQNLVFLETASPPPEARPSGRRATASWQVSLDITTLFRFSALTFNAHRIHYDLDYARDGEGYPGLVVHGPLQAMLLMTHLMKSRPGASIAEFSFRAVRPLILGTPVELCLAEDDEGVELWTADPDGTEYMQGRATLAA